VATSLRRRTVVVAKRLLFFGALFIASTLILYVLMHLGRSETTSQGILAGYWGYLSQLGDTSAIVSDTLQPGMPVMKIALGGFWLSLKLVAVALLISFSISVAYGLLVARGIDMNRIRISGLILLVLASLPVFVVGYAAREIVNPIVARMFEEGVIDNPRDYLIGMGAGWLQYTLAAVTLGLGDGFVANQAFAIRDEIAELRRKDFVHATQILGGSLWRHMAPNLIIPFVTNLAARVSILLGGVIIVETVYSLNGAGRIFWKAALSGDMPVMMVITMLFCLVSVVVRWGSEFIGVLVDPRLAAGAKGTEK